jgi:cell division protein FtsZ
MMAEPEMMADEDEGDELLLDSVDMTDEDMAPAEEAAEDMPAPAGTRSWLTRDEEAAEAAPEPRQGGTLFERMSNIARGAAKAQVEEEPEANQRMRAARDPLDIPRFLNRQNNQ